LAVDPAKFSFGKISAFHFVLQRVTFELNRHTTEQKNTHPRAQGGSNTGRRRGERGIAAAATAALAPWVRPPTRCARAGAVLAASDREGFDACGEEDRGKRPARDGDDAGTGGSRRVAAHRPHRQQLRGLDAAHSESTAMAVTTATGREHEDGDCGGDCEDVTMDQGEEDQGARGDGGRG
jgi:hypothetical protein